MFRLRQLRVIVQQVFRHSPRRLQYASVRCQIGYTERKRQPRLHRPVYVARAAQVEVSLRYLETVVRLGHYLKPPPCVVSYLV